MFLFASDAYHSAFATVLSFILIALLSGCIWAERPLLFEKLGSPDTPLLANRTYAAFTYKEGAGEREPTEESNSHLTLQAGTYSLAQDNEKSIQFRLFHISRIVPELFRNEKGGFYIVESSISNPNDSTKMYLYGYLIVDENKGIFSIYSQSCKELGTFTGLDVFIPDEINDDSCEAFSFEDLQSVTVAMMLRREDRKKQGNPSGMTMFMLMK